MHIESRNRIIIFVSFFTALTAIGAFIKIPLPHIPITLQTFFVIMSGNMLGYKFGTLSQMLYLILGLIGIPIFAYGGGPGYVFQPTFGYLLGYPIGAFSIGVLLRLFYSHSETTITFRRKTFLVFLLADVFGVLVIFMFGLAYLYINLKLVLYLRLEQFASVNINWKASVEVVVLMFIPIDLVKALLASWLTVHVKQLIKFNISFGTL